ncbi:hypothetical protein BH09PSE4_BH09PSE4_02910 [soil metagenome]
MRYFLDTEFNGFGGALVSIALVPEDENAAPFYEAVRCIDPTPWVAQHVLPVLQTNPLERAEVARRFADYLGDDEDPILVADWPEDIAQAAMLLVAQGRRAPIDRMTFRFIDPIGFDSSRSDVPHNAYHDAVALRAYVLAREK